VLDTHISIPVRSSFHSVQAGSGAQTASYPKGTGAVSPRAKLLGRESDLSSPSSAEVKNGGAIPPLPRISLYPIVTLHENRPAAELRQTHRTDQLTGVIVMVALHGDERVRLNCVLR
jgi:hypothetical protein